MFQAKTLGATALLLVLAGQLSAQERPQNPRFGRWMLESDRPPPYSNIMTYAPHGDTGMSITVTATNAQGVSSEWGYVTNFVDDDFHPVSGQEGADTAVEIVDERTNRIVNRRNGRTYQVIINTLSEDGNTIENEYVRLDEAGRITRVTHATYRRIVEG